jgi:tetratricopeptide (TPR) repeat protein
MGKAVMWNAESTLIQIDLGTSVAEAITPPDERGWFAKNISNELPPNAFDRLFTLSSERIESLKNESLIVPTPINWEIDEDINSTSFRIYTGIDGQNFSFTDDLEAAHNSVEGREEIRSAILDSLEKVIRKNQELLSRDEIRESLFQSCLALVAADDYQSAFEQYQKVYYSSSLQDFVYEHIRCLSDVSCIFLRNGDYPRAHSALQKAIKLCDEDPNIVDIHLKAQVSYIDAQILKASESFSEANDYYVKAGSQAFYAGNYPLMFLSMLGIAEVRYAKGDLEIAVRALEEAEKLILSQDELIESDPAWKRACELERMIRKIEKEIKKQEIEQLTDNISKSSFNQITKLVGVILSSLIPPTINSIVYKLFGVSGTLTLAIFGSADYSFGNNTVFVHKPSGSVNIREFGAVS